jgi:hypothetical protein
MALPLPPLNPGFWSTVENAAFVPLVHDEETKALVVNRTYKFVAWDRPLRYPKTDLFPSIVVRLGADDALNSLTARPVFSNASLEITELLHGKGVYALAISVAASGFKRTVVDATSVHCVAKGDIAPLSSRAVYNIYNHPDIRIFGYGRSAKSVSDVYAVIRWDWSFDEDEED